MKESPDIKILGVLYCITSFLSLLPNSLAGDAAEAGRVLDFFDRYDPKRAVVVPPATLVQDHM
ncbi:MAG: hypothetical protein KIT39_10975 [Nitrospirales bacterium]|nr:hypothetical protein [Nitrospirales bacterium]